MGWVQPAEQPLHSPQMWISYYNNLSLPLNWGGVDVGSWSYKLLCSLELLKSPWIPLGTDPSSSSWLLRASRSCWGSVLNSGIITYSSVLPPGLPSSHSWVRLASWQLYHKTFYLPMFDSVLVTTDPLQENKVWSPKQKWIKVESIWLLIPVINR